MAIVVEGGGTHTTVVSFSDSEPKNSCQRDEMTDFSVLKLGAANIHDVGQEGIVDLSKQIVRDLAIESPEDEHLLFSTAGIEDEGHRALVRSGLLEAGFSEEKSIVLGDMEFLLRALNNKGIVLIAGTGMNCLGQLEDKVVQYGGLGPAIGGEGSGFWLGKRAVNSALLASQGHHETALSEVVREHFISYFASDEILTQEHLQKAYAKLHTDDWPGAVISFVYADTSSEHRALYAPLAKKVLEAFSSGDREARNIVFEGLDNLTDAVSAVAGKLESSESLQIGLRGGLFESDLFLASFKELLQGKLSFTGTEYSVLMFSDRSDAEHIDVYMEAFKNSFLTYPFY